jgi:arylsulfatase A-like enzyme
VRFSSLIILTCSLSVFSVQAQETDFPDILFIAIDDLNDWVGVLEGHPQARTPNIDALAARGTLFTNAHSNAALCNPSRTSLMLGLRPSTLGIYGNNPNWMEVESLAELPTIPRFLRDHGYSTFGAGKIFHAHTFRESGFYGYNDPSSWDAFYPSLERQLPDEVTPITRPVNRNPIDPRFDWGPVVVDDRAMGDGQVTHWVENQLNTEVSGPRFTAVGIFRPHLPWYVPQSYIDMHPLEDIILPVVPENDLDDLPDLPLNSEVFERNAFLPPREIHQWAIDSNKWSEGVQAYLASTSFADAMVGRVIEALDKSGRADNTIIILWSDHGWHLGEKHRWRKTTLWEESTRVPFIVVVPGMTTPGTRSVRTVSLIDIFPTVAELVGLQPPNYLEGASLVPLLRNPDASWDRPAISTLGFENHAVRTEDFRYIRYSDGSEELYDHKLDSNEWVNLANDSSYIDVIAELSEFIPERNAPDLAN